MADSDIKAWDERLKDQTERGWNNYFRRRLYLDQVRTFDNLAIAGEFLYVDGVSSDTAAADLRLNLNTNDPIALELGTVVQTIFTNCIISNAAQVGEWIDIVWGINFEYFKQHEVRIAGAVTVVQPVSVDDNGGSLTVDDGGGSITVDGIVAVSAVAGNVTIIDGGGSITVDDGGGALTVDGTVAIVGSVTVVDGGGSLTVDGTVTIVDGGGSITVDGSVAVSAVGGTVTTDDKDGNAQPCITMTNGSADTNTVGAANACKIVLIRAHTTNTGLVWVNCGAAAVDGSCYPLDTGDAVSFRTTNTNQINALFKVANEKITVLYQN